VTEWQVTATTIYCDAVDDDVTIMVNRDWSTRCTGYKKYAVSPDKETAKKLKSKAKRLGRNLVCEGQQDCIVTDYRDRLIAQDKAIPAPAKQVKKKSA